MKLIECNKEKLWGQPSLIERRLAVYDIVTKIAIEDTLEIALEDYQINIVEAEAAINYCRKRICQEDKDLVHFCHGCILRTLQEGWNFKKDDYVEVKNEDGSTITISKNKKIIFAGTIEELEDQEFGKLTWLIAEEIYNKYFQKE